MKSHKKKNTAGKVSVGEMNGKQKEWIHDALDATGCEPAPDLPKTRADCPGHPCPFFICKHNLYLTVNESTGSIKFNFPGVEFWELEQTCVLEEIDANADGVTLHIVGEKLNFTRERARQIEEVAKNNPHLKKKFIALGIDPNEYRETF